MGSDSRECRGGAAQDGSPDRPIPEWAQFLGPREIGVGVAPGRPRGRGRPPRRGDRHRDRNRDGRPPSHMDVPLSRSRHGGQDVNKAGRGRDRTLARVQGTPHHALAQSTGRAIPAPGQVQRRTHLAAAARGGRPRRPDLGGRLRPDGCDRRLRPDPRGQVRDLLRPAHPRGHARRAPDHGLGPPTGPVQAHQAGGGPQVARGAARQAPDRRRARRTPRPARPRSSRRWPSTPTPSGSSA